jgi:hypothetical protein
MPGAVKRDRDVINIAVVTTLLIRLWQYRDVRLVVIVKR